MDPNREFLVTVLDNLDTFLDRLEGKEKEDLAKIVCDLWAYCLMTNGE